MGITNAKCSTPDVNYVLRKEKEERRKGGWLRLPGERGCPPSISVLTLLFFLLPTTARTPGLGALP